MIGKDDGVDVFIDSEGSLKRKSKKVSDKHREFYVSVFREIEAASNLDIYFTDSDDADIVIHNTGKRGGATRRKGYFDLNARKDGRKKLTDLTKEILAARVLSCFGLDYFTNKDDHDGDDSLMSYWSAEMTIKD